MQITDTMREILFRSLRESEVQILFTKKDGTERDMKCTLNPSLIPLDHKPKGTSQENENSITENFIRVFDTQVSGWRTVILDSISNFNCIS